LDRCTRSFYIEVRAPQGEKKMNAPTLAQLKVKLFTDGADRAQIVEMAKQPWIAGFTTNPSLLKKAGVSDYAAYARDLVAAVPDRHISFEVFSDDVTEMVAQARVIASWGKNVYVKLPVTNTRGEPLFEAVRTLSREGVRINMTAIFTGEQAARAVEALNGSAPACVSVFAGRLADFGLDYRPIMQDAIARARKTRNVEIIWASTREVFNVVEADVMDCHIITAPAEVLKKLPALGTRTAAELSLAAVKSFRDDAVMAGLQLPLLASRAAE
jgi:transaldolase